MNTVRLRTLVVAAESADASFVARVLEDHGDEVRISDDVMDALAHLTRDPFDVVIVSLSLPRGDGLALVHHVRALYPGIDVIVLSTPHEMEETAHAIALGVLQSVLLPLSGDAILVAADRARERRLLVEDRARLARAEAMSRRRTATYARCAAFVAETTVASVASRVLDACDGELALRAGAIYVPSLTSSGLVQLAVLGEGAALPREVDGDRVAEIDPTEVVQSHASGIRVVMIGETDIVALAELVPRSDAARGGDLEGLEVVAALGTAALVAARKVEAIARTGIKDPDTSAYTFAYFGDVAGREIDRAARHGRRFGLMTLSLDGMDDIRQRLSHDELLELRRAVTDAVLASVRDSDVLARVEDDEYFLLLPETAMLGVASARRRIHTAIARSRELERLGLANVDPVAGVAVYPSDGADLGRLLRVGRRRSERSRIGPYRRLGLGRLSFWESVDRLLGRGSAPPSDARSPSVDAASDRVHLPADLEEAHSETSLSAHRVMPRALVARIASQMATDVLRSKAPGTIYVAGDAEVTDAVVEALAGAELGPLRAWVLGKGSEGAIRLAVHDPRLEEQTLLLAMTELGGYLLVARSIPAQDEPRLPQGSPDPGERMLVYHSSDLDVVEGLVASLQAEYHLQPEVAS